MRTYLIIGILFFALSLALFQAPGWMEGPSLYHLGPGRGVSVSDVAALLPLAIGAALIGIPVWRQQPWTGEQLKRILAAGGGELFCLGLAAGLILAKGLTALQWHGLFNLMVAAGPLLIVPVILWHGRR
jgi:hypothetical protein